MSRILRPDGQLIVTVPDGAEDDWDGHVNFWSAADLWRLLLPYGVQQVTPVPPDGDLLAHAIKPSASGRLCHPYLPSMTDLDNRSEEQ
jgi:hypothetical protein